MSGAQGPGSRCDNEIVVDDCPGDVVAPLANMATVFAILALVMFLSFAACAVCQWYWPWRKRRHTGPEPAAAANSNSSEDPCFRSDQSTQPEERKDEGTAGISNSLSICVIMAGEERPTYLAQPCLLQALTPAPQECTCRDPSSVSTMLSPSEAGEETEDHPEIVVDPKNDAGAEDNEYMPF